MENLRPKETIIPPSERGDQVENVIKYLEDAINKGRDYISQAEDENLREELREGMLEKEAKLTVLVDQLSFLNELAEKDEQYGHLILRHKRPLIKSQPTAEEEKHRRKMELKSVEKEITTLEKEIYEMLRQRTNKVKERLQLELAKEKEILNQGLRKETDEKTVEKKLRIIQAKTFSLEKELKYLSFLHNTYYRSSMKYLK